MPINASLTMIAVVAAFWFLREAQAFVIPVVIAIVLSFALAPIMRLGLRLRLPVAASASLLIAGFLSLLGLGLSSVAADAAAFGTRVPQIAVDVSTRLRHILERQQPPRPQPPDSAPGLSYEDYSGDRFASGGSAYGSFQPMMLGQSSAPQTTTVAPVDPETVVSPSTLKELAKTTASGVAAGAGHATVIGLLTFFFLLSAQRFKRKLIDLVGATLDQKKTALRAVEDSARQVQFFLGITLLTNVVIGVLSWAWLEFLGLENAGAWAFSIAVLHTIPYFGAAIGTLLISAASLLQTDSWAITLQVAVGTTVICSVVGVLVMTFLQGRVARMDPAMVFLGVLLFGWLWGVWGVLLGAPILAIVKTISEHAGIDKLATVLRAQ